MPFGSKFYYFQSIFFENSNRVNGLIFQVQKMEMDAKKKVLGIMAVTLLQNQRVFYHGKNVVSSAQDPCMSSPSTTKPLFFDIFV